ncbi:MAG: DUF4157 domain-containing protein [Balneolaceae bacterium]
MWAEPLSKRPSIQNNIKPKLKIGKPDDRLEQQADRVADAVMLMPDQPLQMQALEDEEELQMQPMEEEEIQMKPAIRRSHDGNMITSPTISSKISEMQGTGQSLPAETQEEMGNKMGTDFSRLSIHTGPDASQLSDNLGARAFTVGNDIYFNRGEYKPGTTEGRRLIAHELVHTVQKESMSPQYGSATVYGKWWKFWNWFSDDEIEDMNEAIQIIDSHVSEAQQVFDAAANTIGESEIRNILNRAKSNLNSISGILSSAELNIERFENVSGLARAIEALSNIDVSKDPAAAADEFDNFFKFAGAVGQEINNPVLSSYANFLQQLGEQNFFSKLSRTLRQGYGGQGSGIREEINREFERQGKGRVYD